MSSGVRVRVLGPVDVVADGVARAISGLRRKSVLAVLALHPGVVVDADRLIDLVWDDAPPATASNALQRHISYLRRQLGSPTAITARSSGYLLNVPADATEVAQVIQRAGQGGRAGDGTGV